MASILEACEGYPVKTFAPGETLITEGATTGLLFILIEGSVEVVKDDVTVARTSEPGAVFGDLSVLLDVPHTAQVRAVQPSSCYVVEDGREFLLKTPSVCLHLCVLLARRLDALNNYLVDVKHQFAGHDHIGLLDGVLDTLMHRQPRRRVIPKDSTLRDPEIAD